MDTDTSPELSDSLRHGVLDIAAKAEGLGFDSFWVGDSVLAEPRPERY